MPASRSGARASCPASTRAWNAARPASLCCISTIRMMSAAPRGGRCWTRWTRSTATRTRNSAIPKPSRGSRNMSWRSACRWKPARRWTSAASRRPCWRAMAPNPARPAMPTTALLPAGWRSGVCASSSCITGAGIPTVPPRTRASISASSTAAGKPTSPPRRCWKT